MMKLRGIWSTLSSGPLNLRPLTVFPKVLFPPNFIIKACEHRQPVISKSEPPHI